VSRRSSLTIECERPGAGAPRPGRCCTGWGGDTLPRVSVRQDAITRCSGCSMCVASSKTRFRSINMRLVAHVAGKGPFFSRESCRAAALAPKGEETSGRRGFSMHSTVFTKISAVEFVLIPLTESGNSDVSWRFFIPSPKKPLKNYPGNTPKIPLQLPCICPANPLASNQIRHTLGAGRLVTCRAIFGLFWLFWAHFQPRPSPPLGAGSNGVESQLQSEEA